MTEQPQPKKSKVDAAIEERHAAEQAQRARLAAVDLDGPFDFPGGPDLVSSFFGLAAARNRFAVCLRCGSMVVLNDPEEQADGGLPLERGVRLHLVWHNELEVTR